MKCHEIIKVVLHCKAGSEIWESKREAIILALTENRAVEFEHNGHLYRIDPSEIITNIKIDVQGE